MMSDVGGDFGALPYERQKEETVMIITIETVIAPGTMKIEIVKYNEGKSWSKDG